ncbi:hypothetical protein QBC36DRAFT_325215 [Triangularia setosa]|uniref:Uncharacterized protein n=1 Tax=Triangularia setosa TaxID=2587417 RepID=A0AAN6WAC7_9PEZI|nr:hypothetical protein QBC36DRAFT_325215 [Podospora setosa]
MYLNGSIGLSTTRQPARHLACCLLFVVCLTLGIKTVWGLTSATWPRIPPRYYATMDFILEDVEWPTNHPDYRHGNIPSRLGHWLLR